MNHLLNNPFVEELIKALAWGPPYWPETGLGLALLASILWLVLRISRERPEEASQPSPRVEVAKDDTYEAAVEEMLAERKLEETLKPPPVFEAPEMPVPPEEVEIPEEEIPEEEEIAGEAVAEEEIAAEEALEAVSPVSPAPGVAEAPPIEEEALIVEEPPAEDFLSRLKRSLKSTQESLLGRIDSLFRGAKKLDENLYEELEETLVTADLGVETAYKLLGKIQKEGERGALKNPEAARDLLKNEILKMLEKVDAPLSIGDQRPFIIMVLGVNGTGKTTTIAKLAYRYRKEGKKVLLAAGDTFRAAAIEQLGIWAKRVGADIVKHAANSDPSAVAFDAIQAAKARGVDIVIVDTAGRIHTRVPLMEELKKVKRIIGRELEGAPHETLLVLDSTTGQNAVSQTQAFNEALGVTGLVLTKLDGTAKGGILVGISDKFKIPIRFIGIGEKMYDLAEFKARPFVDALFE